MTKMNLWAAALTMASLTALGAAPAQAVCIDNESSANLKITIAFFGLNSRTYAQDAGQNLCHPYGFIGETTIAAAGTKVPNADATGDHTFIATTDSSRFRVYNREVRENNGRKQFVIGMDRVK